MSCRLCVEHDQIGDLEGTTNPPAGRLRHPVRLLRTTSSRRPAANQPAAATPVVTMGRARAVPPSVMVALSPAEPTTPATAGSLTWWRWAATVRSVLSSCQGDHVQPNHRLGLPPSFRCRRPPTAGRFLPDQRRPTCPPPSRRAHRSPATFAPEPRLSLRHDSLQHGGLGGLPSSTDSWRPGQRERDDQPRGIRGAADHTGRFPTTPSDGSCSRRRRSA